MVGGALLEVGGGPVGEEVLVPSRGPSLRAGAGTVEEGLGGEAYHLLLEQLLISCR